MEKKELKANYNKVYGWFWNAKEIALYCNTTFQLVMALPALEVAGLSALMKAEYDYKNI